MKTWLIALAVSLLLSAYVGAQSAYPRAQLLIEAKDLQAAAGKYVVLDARSKKQYAEGHIPGAIWVDLGTWAKAFNVNPNAKDWPARVGALGIDGSKPVVVYDEGSVTSSARVWYILRYLGVKDVRLVNGNLPAWKSQNLPITSKQETVRPVVFNAGPPIALLYADKDRMLDFLKSKKTQIIDSRSLAEFQGEAEMAKRNGTMPGAVHLEWIDSIDSKTGKFKSADALAKQFKDAGVDLVKPSVTFCQSGGRASVMLFTMELMGAKDVANYYRSWAEWGNAEKTPIVTPAKK